MNRIFAIPKINIGLRIVGRRADGYHLLESLFFPFYIKGDEIRIEKTARHDIKVICGHNAVDPDKNTLTSAWNVFAERTGFAPGVNVTLYKNIPAGAGLGGGSADASSLLLWLNRQAPKPLADDELAAAALEIGADVPFFLQGRPALVRGIGEVVEPLSDPVPNFYIVCVWPGISVASGWAYRAYDELAGLEKTPGGQNLLTKPLEAVKKSIPHDGENAGFFQAGLVNDLELPVFDKYPVLAAIKEKFFALGAFQAGMSGSGSAIYGLFEDISCARHAQKILREDHENVFFARSKE